MDAGRLAHRLRRYRVFVPASVYSREISLLKPAFVQKSANNLQVDYPRAFGIMPLFPPVISVVYLHLWSCIFFVFLSAQAEYPALLLSFLAVLRLMAIALTAQ